MQHTGSGSPARIIASMDTGIDDAMALAYLCACGGCNPCCNLVGVVGSYGNVDADTATANTRAVLDLFGRPEIPVFRGSARPSWANTFIPDAGCAQFHGADGLGGTRLAERQAASQSHSLREDASSPDPGEGVISATGVMPSGSRPPADSTPPAENMVLNAGMTQDGGMAAAENTMPSEGLVSIGGYPLGDPHANPAIAASHSRASGTSTGSRTLSSSIDTTANRNGTGNHAFSRTGHNPNGLNSIRNSDGIDFLIDQIRAYGRNLTVLVTGPLTDVDAAITASPDIIANLRLVIMGGTLTQPGNCWDGVAETNIMQDPEAANRVFHSGADVTMVGLDVTHQCLLGSDAANIWRATGTERGRFLADIADFSIAANLRSDPVLFRAGMPLHDPLAAAVALDPTLVDCFDIALRAETETGDIHGVRGRTIGDPSGLTTGGVPRTHVALNVDKARFTADFTGRLTALCRD